MKYIVLLLFVSSLSHAHCEGERRDYEKFKASFERFSKIAAAAGTGCAVAGYCALGPVGGAIGSGAAVPFGVRAQEEKKKMEAAKRVLDRCVAKVEAEEKAAIAYNEKLLRNYAVFLREEKRVLEIHQQEISKIKKEFQDELDNFIKELVNEGYDINNPETIKLIENKETKIQSDLQIEIDIEEFETNQSIKRYRIDAKDGKLCD